METLDLLQYLSQLLGLPLSGLLGLRAFRICLYGRSVLGNSGCNLYASASHKLSGYGYCSCLYLRSVLKDCIQLYVFCVISYLLNTS